MDDITRIPPHNVEAEQSLLGCFLIDPMLCYKVREINYDDFYKEAHKVIFENIKLLVGENKPIDIVTLSNKLKQSESLDDVGGISYITSLPTIVPTTGNIDHYIKIIQDRIIGFISSHSNISKERLETLMMETGMLTKDLGTILVGEETVKEGLINAVGGISQAFEKLNELIHGRS